MAVTPYLVDSNVLLRWVKPDRSDNPGHHVRYACQSLAGWRGLLHVAECCSLEVLRSRRLMTCLVVDPILASGLRYELMILGRLHM